MSFQANQLREYYKHTVVSTRRQQDGLWDFINKDSPKVDDWINILIDLIRDDFQDMLADEYHQFLDELQASSIGHFHYALWFACLNLYPNMRNFLLSSETFERADINFLAAFLEQDLSKLFKKWKDGNYTSTKVWLRDVLATYAVTVPCLVQVNLKQQNLLQSDTS